MERRDAWWTNGVVEALGLGWDWDPTVERISTCVLGLHWEWWKHPPLMPLPVLRSF